MTSGCDFGTYSATTIKLKHKSFSIIIKTSYIFLSDAGFLNYFFQQSVVSNIYNIMFTYALIPFIPQGEKNYWHPV